MAGFISPPKPGFPVQALQIPGKPGKAPPAGQISVSLSVDEAKTASAVLMAQYRAVHQNGLDVDEPTCHRMLTVAQRLAELIRSTKNAR